MADNVTANSGSGGATFAADDIGGVHFPRTKLTIGADGANDGDVSAANPLPVTGTVAVTNGGLTELAAAINGSSQLDVNIAASAATVAVSNAGLTELAAAINASSQMDVNIAASGATVPVSNAGLTELAAAINASSQMDVNLAASNATVTVAAHHVTNAGTFAVQVDGNALTALQLIDNTIIVDDAAFTPATTSVSMAGFQADEASTDSVNEGDAGAARMTLDRKLIVNPQPHSAGGLSVFRSLDLDETEEDVKTSPGCLYKLRITNRTTSVRYVKLYNNTAANVDVGTTTPLDTIPIPANASDYTVLTESFGGMGLTFDTALSIAATTGFADNDTGAPGANDIIVSAYYK